LSSDGSAKAQRGSSKLCGVAENAAPQIEITLKLRFQPAISFRPEQRTLGCQEDDMEAHNIACMISAAIIGLGLTATATHADARQPRLVVVEANRIDPALIRRVSYADLNLAQRPAVKILQGRIWNTAQDLCFDLNGTYGTDTCVNFAFDSTKDQVAAAVERAKRQMAGLPVGPAITITMAINGQ
jgi:UrcA family protein